LAFDVFSVDGMSWGVQRTLGSMSNNLVFIVIVAFEGQLEQQAGDCPSLG
jgi:hypothetical protein